MSKAILENDGCLRLPEGFLGRRDFKPGMECWLTQRDSTLVLLPRLPDLHKLYVEPTTVCNLNCRTCIRNIWEDPKKHMDMAVFDQLVEQLKEFPGLQRVVFSGLGEPLTHPHILDMVQRVRERGLAVTIGSNGLLLDEAVSGELVQLGADRLVVSLDGVTPDTYAGVHGATISRVLDNIRSLNKVKSESDSLTPALGIEFVALKSNIGELADLTGLASRLGAARVLVSNVLAYLERFLCGLPVGSGHHWLPLARLYPFAL